MTNNSRVINEATQTNSANAGASMTISQGSGNPNNDKNFEPKELTISKGVTVTWTNNDYTYHTVISGFPEDPNSGSEFDSSYIASGKIFQHIFNSVGPFDYYCALHPFMIGKVVVVDKISLSVLRD
ncbi:MAG: plastocyanin/azurin family copper-binding protein [Nitrososphaerota archaeon]